MYNLQSFELGLNDRVLQNRKDPSIFCPLALVCLINATMEPNSLFFEFLYH